MKTVKLKIAVALYDARACEMFWKSLFEFIVNMFVCDLFWIEKNVVSNVGME